MSQFIVIGSIRIKKSNIKEFGRQTYKDDPSGLFGSISSWAAGKGFLNAVAHGVSGEKKQYLYVTTYQGDNHRFFEHEVNFNETLKELESI